MSQAQASPARTPQARQIIRELETFSKGVPETTAFTSNRKMMLGTAVFGVIILVPAVVFGRPLANAAVFHVALALLLLLQAVLMRDAGRFVFMTLDHGHLRVHNLSAPVSLLDVDAIAYKSLGCVKVVTFKLRPSAPAVAHRWPLGLFTSRALYLRFGGPRVRVVSSGFRVNGVAFSDADMLEVFDIYMSVARVERQLDALRAQHPELT